MAEPESLEPPPVAGTGTVYVGDPLALVVSVPVGLTYVLLSTGYQALVGDAEG